ncbi:spermidine synthase [Agromyces protaetiae]|uniref:spermidine synthase n=1 Tax=Agromyces protaetiae TaxID=2509455 RepID=UPI0013EA2172|nr:fused MFS/spermidine synthase [Agromyces protaetiae]
MAEATLELDGEQVHARLVPNRGTNGGFSLVIDGTTQSHVNPDDPLDIQLEYVRHVTNLIDAWHPSDAPISALHLGGGALSIPRYVAATRPGSRQHVVELHRELFEFVVDALPLRDEVELTAEFDDARAAVDRSARFRGGYDLAVVDVFSGSVAPPNVGTIEFFRGLADLLTPTGIVLVNTLATSELQLSRRMAATLAEEFEEVTALVSEVVLEGAPGNVVLAASRTSAPLDEILRWTASAPRPVLVLQDDRLDRFVDGAGPRRDGDSG